MPGTLTRPPRILIIKPSSLGDIVHALPVLAAARRAHPQAHIAWLVARSFASLLEGHPLLNEVIVFERNRLGKIWRYPNRLGEILKFAGGLRARRFDLVVDLQGLLRSGLLTWASGARRRVGFAAARELSWLFYSQLVRPGTGLNHAVDRNLAVAGALGWPVTPVDFPYPIAPPEMATASDLLNKHAISAGFVAVILGARWESKRWPDAQFVKLLDGLAGRGVATVLLGGPDDRSSAEQIALACRVKPVNLVGATSLRGLAAVLAKSELVVAHDSGPLHLAAALGRPTLALFGPTDPAKTGPYGPAGHTITNPVPCAPCLRRRCPLGHQDCLRKLDADAVLAQALAFRAAPPAPPSPVPPSPVPPH